MEQKLTWEQKFLRFIKRQRKKTTKHTLLALTAVVLVMTANLFWKGSEAVEAAGEGERAVFTASLVGDVMLGRYVERVAEKHGYDYLFELVKPYFARSDYATGNFEQAVLLRQQLPRPLDDIPLKTGMEGVRAVKRAGFTVVSFANNHAMDYGDEGMEDAVKAFEEVGLDYVGAGKEVERAKQIFYTERKGMRVATLGFAKACMKPEERAGDKKPGCLYADPTVVIPLVREAKKNADLVIVHMHWGDEYFTNPTKEQKNMAKALAQAGADIVVGHHPHVLQPVEIYQNTVIFYSLGNFVFDQGWSRTREGALAQYKICEDGRRQVEIVPVIIKEGRPRPALGELDWYRRERIFSQLVKGLPKDLYRIADGKLVIALDGRVDGGGAGENGD